MKYTFIGGQEYNFDINYKFNTNVVRTDFPVREFFIFNLLHLAIYGN